MNHGLSAQQIETLRRILAPYAERIERVDLFGSRAKGSQRLNSDLDLVVHGTLSEADIDRLWTLFQESNLPFSVDVKSYAHTRYAPLKAHMNSVGKTLFTHEELVEAQAAMEANLKELGYGG